LSVAVARRQHRPVPLLTTRVPNLQRHRGVSFEKYFFRQIAQNIGNRPSTQQFIQIKYS
jgi:hypothetical protein